jgi:hypothetical protein
MTESASTPRLRATFAIYLALVAATTVVGPHSIPSAGYYFAGLAGFVLVAIACLGRMEEFQTHVRGALNNGVTPNEIRAVLTQIAVYCGIPAGVDCFRHAKPVIEAYQKSKK